MYKINADYNFYHPELSLSYIYNALNDGIIGWTKEDNINNKSPSGKAIYTDPKRNKFTYEDHRGAERSLADRANRIRESLDTIPEAHRPRIMLELSNVEAQKAHHKDQYLAIKEAEKKQRKPALVKSLKRLRETARLS